MGIDLTVPEVHLHVGEELRTTGEAGGVYERGASPVTGCPLPFGGIGISGFGREGGPEGLLEFVRTKAVAIV